MTMIFCDENCIYQKDGCCQLECASAVTNLSSSGCMHRIAPDELSLAAKEHRPHPVSSVPQ